MELNTTLLETCPINEPTDTQGAALDSPAALLVGLAQGALFGIADRLLFSKDLFTVAYFSYCFGIGGLLGVHVSLISASIWTAILPTLATCVTPKFDKNITMAAAAFSATFGAIGALTSKNVVSTFGAFPSAIASSIVIMVLSSFFFAFIKSKGEENEGRHATIENLRRLENQLVLRIGDFDAAQAAFEEERRADLIDFHMNHVEADPQEEAHAQELLAAGIFVLMAHGRIQAVLLPSDTSTEEKIDSIAYKIFELCIKSRFSLSVTSACPICQESISLKERVVYYPTAGNPIEYHVDCIKPWIKSLLSQGRTPTCPSTRGGLL